MSGGEVSRDGGKGLINVLNRFDGGYINQSDCREMIDRLVQDFLSSSLQEAYDKGFINGARKADSIKISDDVFDGEHEFSDETPEGVSQWKARGKKYGYWEYFKKEVYAQALMDVVAKLETEHTKAEDPNFKGGIAHCINNITNLGLKGVNEKPKHQ